MAGGASSAFFSPTEGAVDAAAMDRDAEAFAHQLDQLGGGQLRLFALRRLQRLDQLERAIRRYIDTVNSNPRPFRWTKSADDILATIRRFCLRTLDAAERQKEIIKTSESGHYDLFPITVMNRVSRS